MKGIDIRRIVSFMCVLGLLMGLGLSLSVYGDAPPGTNVDGFPLTEVTMGSIVPVVTETGLVSLSVDGLGTTGATGTVQVEKAAGAVVRSAYLGAASRGFSGYVIPDGSITIDGVGVNWDITTPSSISSYNHWADVTSLVKPKVDAAPAGRVDFEIGEANSGNIDGEILAVILDDPNQTTNNTIVLLFGAQDVSGDTFAIALAEPLDLSDPALALDLGLGISFGFQGTVQYSVVEVNGARLSTSAGGQDEGQPVNGALLTVGGLDDSNANPVDPFALPVNEFSDDELYDLEPFVADGDTAISVFTVNPSVDDNIYFASLFLASATAIVGEGILLSPLEAINPVGAAHEVVAMVQDDDGNPVVGREVTFQVVSGPHAGASGVALTDASGEATWSYVGTAPGTDVIEARFVSSQGEVEVSNQVTKEWEGSIETELWAVEYRWGDPAPGYRFVDMRMVSWLDVRIENRGAADAFNVTAEVSSWPRSYVDVPIREVTVGDIPVGGSAWSVNRFWTIVDLTMPQDPCEQIMWRIEYDDASGVHHVIEDVPEFPPGEGPVVCQ